MRINKKEMGARIAKARLARGIMSQAELCRQMLALIQQRAGGIDAKRGRNLTPQAISSWENGEAIPSWENLAILVAVLETDEEVILFGKTGSGKSIPQERFYMSRISEEEGRLLTHFREASKEGQKAIIESAKTLAHALPAPAAEIHPLRRKNDRYEG